MPNRAKLLERGAAVPLYAIPEGYHIVAINHDQAIKDHQIAEIVGRVTKVVKAYCPGAPQSIRAVISKEVNHYFKPEDLT